MNIFRLRILDINIRLNYKPYLKIFVQISWKKWQTLTDNSKYLSVSNPYKN